MKGISVSNDIVPLREFKAELSKWLRSVQQSSQAVIITQNGKPAGVLLSPKDCDELRHSRLFLAAIKRGIADASSDRVLDTPRLRQELEKRRRQGAGVMKVVWTAEALEQLAAIEDMIARNNPARAQKSGERLIKRGQCVSRFPRRGRIVPEPSDPEIREVFVMAYRVVYSVQRTRIESLTLFEGHRLLRQEEIRRSEKHGR